MLNQIRPSRRLAILLSGVWLFVSGLFASTIGADELFTNFDTTGRFLVTWVFVGVMPLGLVWGATWVVDGLRAKRREPSETEMEQQRNASHRLLKVDYRKGLWRLWIIGTSVWFLWHLQPLSTSGADIARWLGFHYSLLRDNGSLAGAMAQKRNYTALIEACREAQDTCWVPAEHPRPNSLFPNMERLPNCEETQAFRNVLTRELHARGIMLPTGVASGEPCADALAIGIPYVDWEEFLWIALTPFVVMVIYLIGRWITIGFLGITKDQR